MKNIMKKLTILTAALALAVLFGFAVSDTASAAESRAQAAAADTYMSAATINYSTSTKGDATTISTSGGSNYYVYSVEVKTSGKLYMDALAYNSNSSSCYVDLGTYDGSVFNHGSSTYLSAGSEKDGIGGYDVKKGTYWVGIQSSSSASAYVRAYVIPYSTRKLPAGKMMIASGYKNSYQDSAAKFKIRPTKSGYITVTLKQYGYDSSSGYVTLLNSKKKAVSDKLWYYSSSTTSYVVFGVKKGVTYYLRVNSCQGSSSYQYAYGIKFKQKAALLKKNIKKSKSLLLKRKAKYKSMTRQATGKAMNGLATYENVSYYDEMTRGGYLGLAVLEHCYVSKEGQASEHQLSIAEDACVSSLAKIAEISHKNGVPIIAQLNHAGSAAKQAITGLKPISATAMLNPRNKRLNVGEAEMPDGMSAEDIGRIIKCFAESAIRSSDEGRLTTQLHLFPSL